MRNLEKSDWSHGTAEGSRRAVLRAGLTTTFREKLQWLEKAEELSLRMRRSREKEIEKKL